MNDTRSPERWLLAAVLAQAMRDVRASDPLVQADAIRFCTTGACAWLCELLGVDAGVVQARARRILDQAVEAPAPLE